MRNPIVIAIVLAAILAALGISWGMHRARQQRDPFENMKAGVTQTSGPLAVSAARAGCPISLPESATNIEYAVWSLWQASQTFVRFEAPASDCLQHARTILATRAARWPEHCIHEHCRSGSSARCPFAEGSEHPLV